MRILWLLLSFLTAFTLWAEGEFIRVERMENSTDCLQVAIKTYAVADNKKVQLVGVSHVGTQKYYEGLQKNYLNPADVVLFEGVDGDRASFRHATAEQSPERSGLQVNLARALGLVFQLHHIDYDQAHFVNSDLSSEQLLALFEGKEMPESSPAAQAQMEELLAGMEEASVSGQVAAAALAFLELRPGWSRAMRWGMVKMLGSVTGNVSEYPGLPDHLRTLMQVLIEKRNEKVMSDIHDQLAGIPEGGTVAVFYGAAHMHDFEERLGSEMQAERIETVWETAFSGNLQTSGLNLLEKRTISWFVNQQVRALRMISIPADASGEE
ncbi:hypothetical protein P0Y35_06450 [Kiritimatiellaeota bacterium B1221]|nr:hypothetical protein [Kiritimatiellaeota bacterium B1221]